MKKEIKVALKTMGIKAKVANYIRTTLYKKRLDNISDKEKIQIFEEVFKLNKEAHTLLNNYKSKRQYKAEIALLRQLQNA